MASRLLLGEWTMNQMTTNLMRLENAESFLSYRWPQGLRPSLETEIKLLRRQIPPGTMAAYTRLKRRRGQAMAEVVGGVCQACRTRVPPALVMGIERNQGVVCCRKCGRFIYLAASIEKTN